MKTRLQNGLARFCILLWSGSLLLSSCLTASPAPRLPADGAPALASAASSATEASADEASTPPAPTAAIDVVPPTATATVAATPQPIKITIQSSQSSSSGATTVKVVTATPALLATEIEATSVIPAEFEGEAEPVIFIGYSVPRACGVGAVVAADGHQLHATPRLRYNNSNFLALLPEGAQVDIIDCNLWVDAEDLSWLAVRTAEGKFGWMLVQPDKFYITLFPVAHAPVRSVTGIPAGATVAYMPPSVDSCRDQSASNEAVATSIGIDLIPVVGDLKGLQEAATGCDAVTGESLGDWRWLGLLGIIGLSEVSLMRHTLRHGDSIASGARAMNNMHLVRQGDEAVVITGRNLDTAAGIGRAASKLDDAGNLAPGAVRAAQNQAGLPDETLKILEKFEQPCSFSGETVVVTQSGPKPIRHIQPGEHVLAYDQALGVTGYYTVTAAFAHLDMEILRLRVGEDHLETTPEHPFYVDGRWIPARDLAVADHLFSSTGDIQPVQAINIEQRPQVMYNLTVAVAQTYFVGAGHWLVHNACARVLRRHLDPPQQWQEVGIQWQAHHLIPGQLEDHDFVRKAIDEGGWNIDGPGNGIALPVSEADAVRLGVPVHHGPHPQYTAGVEGELNQLQAKALADEAAGNPWPAQKYRDELERLAEKKRREILSRPPGRLN